MGIVSKVLRKILPWRWYKLLANGWIIVPAYYKTIIDDAEKNFDLSLGNSSGKDLMLMRKYGHILDKGLHLQDATPGHSKTIYLELKKKIKALEKDGYSNEPTVKWAKKKLEYYEILQNDSKNFKPLEGDSPKCDISFNEIESLIKQRRSNRSFSTQPITNEEIEKLGHLVHWAANSCNKQPIVLFVTNKPIKAAQCLNCCKGGTGFSDYIPSFWVFAADIRGYVWPTEIFLPTLDTSLGAQNIFLAASTLGISGTILTWAQKDKKEEKQLRLLMNIPEYYSIIFCAVLGRANHTFIHPTRKVEK